MCGAHATPDEPGSGPGRDRQLRTVRLPRGPAVVGLLAGAAVVAALAGVFWAAFPPVVGPRPALPDAVAARGQRIYAASCQACHGGPVGGAMMDYPPKHNASGHTWHHPDCELLEVITTGSGPMTRMMREMMAPPGAPTMPAWREKLSDDEIDAVLAYIKTMWTPEQREIQERATRQQC